MTTESVLVNNHLVMRDHEKTWRWFDVFGPAAVKWSFDARNVVSTTTAAGCTVTQTNGTLVTVDSTTGGAVKFTLGGADNDKVEVQSFSELFKFASAWPAYFGVKIGTLVDPAQTDISAGFVIRDTDIAGGVTDGIYFRIVDESAVLSLVLEQDSAETTVELFTAATSTDYTIEMFYDGAGYVHAYVNGALVSSTATTNANWCDDEDLTATIAVQAGEGSANHVNVYWVRAFQIQEA